MAFTRNLPLQPKTHINSVLPVFLGVSLVCFMFIGLSLHFWCALLDISSYCGRDDFGTAHVFSAKPGSTVDRCSWFMDLRASGLGSCALKLLWHQEPVDLSMKSRDRSMSYKHMIFEAVFSERASESSCWHDKAKVAPMTGTAKRDRARTRQATNPQGKLAHSRSEQQAGFSAPVSVNRTLHRLGAPLATRSGLLGVSLHGRRMMPPMRKSISFRDFLFYDGR